MRRTFAILLGFSLVAARGSAIASASETVAVEGIVSNGAGGAPIPHASVTLSGESGGIVRTTTDRHGRYRALAFDAGLLTVAIERAGFEPASQQCRVSPGATLRLDVSLLDHITNIVGRFRCTIEPQTVDRYIIR